MSKLFDKAVTIEGARTNAPRVFIACRCCVMDGSLDEPFGDSSVQSTRRKITVVVKCTDLGGVEVRPSDIVRFSDGKSFAVHKVEPFYTREIILDCRSC